MSCAMAALVAVLVATPNRAADREFVYEHRFPSHSDLKDGRYRELTYSTGQWYGSTFFTGPDWTRVGKDWHHPGENTPSVRCFIVPRDGRVIVLGRVFKLHRSGDGIRAEIRFNERAVWKTEIDGDDSTGVEHSIPLDVRRGDTLRFVVSKRGSISCDTTGWNPRVKWRSDDTVSVASEAFQQHRQGAGNWRYEMEIDPREHQGLPTIYGWTRNLALLRWTIRPGTAVELTNRDALPLLVVADAEDRGGVALGANMKGQWRFTAEVDPQREIQLKWTASDGTGSDTIVSSQTYRGTWTKGWIRLDDRLERDPPFLRLMKELAAKPLGDQRSLSLRAMVQTDWERQDSIDGSAVSYRGAAELQLQEVQQLLDSLGTDHIPDSWNDPASRVLDLSAELAATGDDVLASRAAWLAVRRLKRRILLADPRYPIGPLLVCKRVPPSWSHLVAQYFGWRQRPGGGLYIVREPGHSLVVEDILQDQLPPGSVLEPRLSYDGQRILFAFVACTDEAPDPASLPVNEQGNTDRYFHLYEVNVDGSGLRQLTDGPYDDMMAEYLPDGDIVFCSTRRKGYSRCFGPEYSYRWHSYTLHRMHPDGSDIHALSYNDVSEWFPSISHSGQILHARWDYIDRDAVTHQNLWSMRPDGSNPVAVWGNATPKPHCTFQAKPIPGSQKIVFIASAHHSITAGPVCLLDPSIDSTSLDAVTRITPLPFPEAEGKLDQWYAAPWPLSEDRFLVAYSPYRLRFQGVHETDPNPDNALGVYLLDAAGNRELLYRDPDIGTTNPMPLAPRPRPPVLPEAERRADSATGTMLVTDVYQGLGNVRRGMIKNLRIVQLFPKTTWLANEPRMGVAGEENGRAILGTVPVEADGSAYFEVPAGKPILFQALDEQGMAYQTMRSLTFAQPGEQVSCIGCHEHRMTTPSVHALVPAALQRPPSTIEPGELGGRPFGFVEVVQPILDRHCIACHGAEKQDGGIDLRGIPEHGFTRSYVSLCGTPADWKPLHFDPTAAKSHLVPRFVQRNQVQLTTPGGTYGARGSRLIKLLADGHEGVALTTAELRGIATWIDLNAIFYGIYDDSQRARQLSGKRVAMPRIQ